MREIEEIISAYDRAKSQHVRCLLSTVVFVEGSSYRRAGARMLVDEYGEITGAISGGCLEGDALRKALYALDEGKNRLVTYDTSDENDAVIGAQLGCNGIIQVLFEPICDTEEFNPIELLRTASKELRSVVITFFNVNEKRKAQVGTTMLYDKNGTIGNKASSPVLQKEIDVLAALALNEKRSFLREYHLKNDQLNVFAEYFPPGKKIVLVGAGNDALILSQQAILLGWRVVVVDGRQTHANTNRFSANCQIVVSKPDSFLKEIDIDEQTAFVLITHNYNYDLAVLKALLKHPTLSYLGILGPKKKYTRMLTDLNSEGTSLEADQLNKVYAPIGLEMGAETPAEIGLSILAEIQSVFAKTKPGFLRDKEGPIHRAKNNHFEIIKL